MLIIVQVLAYTNGGEGVKSSPTHCLTDQDSKLSATVCVIALMLWAIYPARAPEKLHEFQGHW